MGRLSRSRRGQLGGLGGLGGLGVESEIEVNLRDRRRVCGGHLAKRTLSEIQVDRDFGGRFGKLVKHDGCHGRRRGGREGISVEPRLDSGADAYVGLRDRRRHLGIELNIHGARRRIGVAELAALLGVRL